MKLYFVEFEESNNELYGEFYIKENVKTSTDEFYNIVLVILCDKNSREVKEFNVLKEFYYKEEYVDSETITGTYKINLKKFVNSLFKI